MENLKIEYLPVKALKPFDKNARAHADYDVGQIAKSIEKYGFDDPIGVWGEENIIVEGHGRLMAAKKLKLKEVPVIHLDHLTDEQRREYALIHNKSAELSTWDLGTLLEEIKALDLSDFDIDWGLGDLESAEENSTIIEDEAPEPPKEAKTKPGMIIKLGRHRLLCGDATKPEDVGKLMDGMKADLYLTDPPYNVAYEGKTKDALTIQNDSMEDTKFRAFLKDSFEAAKAQMKGGAAFYIWHADSEGYNFRGACKDIGWQVRECLIWAKNVMVLGRQDYQWQHEPCQPAGTLVWTPNGPAAIESLKDGDRVISFDTYSGCVKGHKEGLEIKTAQRQYDGLLYGIKAAGKQTWATDNHDFSVRFNPDTAQKWSTYLMVNEKGWWRVGVTRTYDARGFGLKHRVEQEGAVAAWIIETFECQADAQMGEQYIACKYGLPYTHWNVERGQGDKFTTRTETQIAWLYERMDLDEMRKGAERLLADFGRSIKYPLVDEESKGEKFSRRVTAKINACNIIPGLMMVPIPKEHYEGANTFEWAVIDAVEKKEHHGLVYSLAVDKYHHYIADGIVTHNCLYGWNEGGSHAWYSDRKQTTLLNFAKPARNAEHPTMKPVALFDYLIKNSSKRGDVVLDTFGGSGTTIIACEQNGRTGYSTELDPIYCDVIIQRYINLVGSDSDVFVGSGDEWMPWAEYEKTFEEVE